MITIITRTSKRPDLLERLIKSIIIQSYKDHQHLILADNLQAVNYTAKICEKLKYKAKVVRVRKESNNNGFYNLYLNTGISLVKSGWIIIVDDDDYLFSTYFSRVVPTLKDNNRVYICQFVRGGKIKPPAYLFDKLQYKAGDNLNIKSGSIGGGCLIFQQQQVKGCLWDDRRCSDFRFIKQVTAKNDYTFIAMPVQRATTKGNKGSNIYK